MTAASVLRRPSDLADRGGALAGNAHRFYDAASAAWMVKVFPGEFYVTSKPNETLVTVLGSCVAACIRDPYKGIGGMNHFMLPLEHSGGWNGQTQSMRFGNFAMEKLINELIKAGCSRNALEIKVFGGGNVTETRNLIGTENAEFVLRYLKAEGLSVAARDLGGRLPRRINYFPITGKVVRRLLGSADTNAIAREESEYANSLSSRTTAGDIELFE